MEQGKMNTDKTWQTLSQPGDQGQHHQCIVTNQADSRCP